MITTTKEEHDLVVLRLRISKNAPGKRGDEAQALVRDALHLIKGLPKKFREMGVSLACKAVTELAKK